MARTRLFDAIRGLNEVADLYPGSTAGILREMKVLLADIEGRRL